jgi:hypothetical protein
MTILVRVIVVTFLGVGVASAALAQSAGGKAPGPAQMPQDPGVPIGCLLNPNCGPKLFVHPDGNIVTPQAPVDPVKGLPCLLDPKNCGNLLSVPARAALFQRSVTPEDVLTKGTTPGDFIPFPSPPPLAPSLAPSQPTASPSQCTASIIGANESARSAQQSPNDGANRHAALDVVVSAYATALGACQSLRR